MNGRCLHCKKVRRLDLSQVYVFAYRTPPTVVDQSKESEVLNGEVVRGLMCDCKLSVDYEVVGQANKASEDRREYNNPRPKGDSDNARQW